MADEIQHLDFSPRPDALEMLVKAWRKPIEPGLKVMKATAEKPLAELTMPDVLAWAIVLTYFAATGMLLGQLAGNVLVNVLRGPGR